MARRAQVRYFPSRSAYYTTYRGKQHRLAGGPDDFSSNGKHGPNYLAALKVFGELMAYGTADTAGDANTVRVLCERYAEYLEAHKSPATLKRFKREAKHFVQQYGERAVGSMKPYHVDEFNSYLRNKRKWKNTKFPMQQVKNAFVWGVKKKLVTNNPFEGVKLEKQNSNTEAQVISQDTATALISKASVFLRDLLRFLWHTGCRPQEAYAVEGRYYDRDNKCIVFPGKPKPGDFIWKGAKTTGRDRIIYLDDDMVALIEEKVAKHPTGYLFRTKFNKKWKLLNVSQQLRRVEQNNKDIRRGVTPYGFRHTFVTNYLLRGGSIKVLADLCGTSVEMIEQTYSHIHVDKKNMRELMLKTLNLAGSV